MCERCKILEAELAAVTEEYTVADRERRRAARRALALERQLSGQRAEDPRMEDAWKVFECWADIHRNGSKRVVFGEKRRKVVLARLKENYTVTDLWEAILGNRVAGVKIDGIAYDDLEVILRDETKVDLNRRRWVEWKRKHPVLPETAVARIARYDRSVGKELRAA